MINHFRTIEDYELFIYSLAWQDSEKLYWFDSQPHPADPTLASTHPHHKHIPPDIKHNRIPAPDMSFHQHNISVIIREIEALLQSKNTG